jgi:hypothetical protein
MTSVQKIPTPTFVRPSSDHGILWHMHHIAGHLDTKKEMMASRYSKGDYIAQILAYESDTLRLLRDVQQYIMAGNALCAAIFTA